MNKSTIALILVIIVFSFSLAKTKKNLTVIGTWGGHELENFKAVCQAAGFTIQFETTRDLDALLTTRVEANNLPDLAILPNPAKLKELAKKRKIKPIDFLNKSKLGKDYSKTWLDLASYGGKLYGIFYKIGNKSVIWYNPVEFKKNGWQVPETWDELIALNKRIVSAGKTPWSIGADIGWPLSDWIENILIRTAGPQVYQDWIDHKIPWTDPAIKKAFQKWGELVTVKQNLHGGIYGTLATKFQNGAFAVFQENPKAYMYYEGSFMGDIVAAELKNVELGKNMAFFAFPTINPKFKKPVVGGADVIVAFNSHPDVQKLITFLADKQAHEIWVKKGGFVSHNKSVSLNSYPDPINRKSAEIITNAEIFVFDASDLMPPSVGNKGGFWDACKKYLENPNNLDAILADMEKLAKANY